MFFERPFLGWRPIVAFYELGKRENVYSGEWTVGGYKDSHNLFLHLLLEVGIIGTLPFLVGILVCTNLAWKARMGMFGFMPMALLATILVFNLAHNEIKKKDLWMFLAVAASSGIIVQKNEIIRRKMRKLKGVHKYASMKLPQPSTLRSIPEKARGNPSLPI